MFQKECIYLHHFAVQQKLTQHCKSTIFQLKKKSISSFSERHLGSLRTNHSKVIFLCFASRVLPTHKAPGELWAPPWSREALHGWNRGEDPWTLAWAMLLVLDTDSQLVGHCAAWQQCLLLLSFC